MPCAFATFGEEIFRLVVRASMKPVMICFTSFHETFCRRGLMSAFLSTFLINGGYMLLTVAMSQNCVW